MFDTWRPEKYVGQMVDNAFRAVPRTGVIYVTSEARRRGFAHGAPGWVNFGQGAPETGAIPGAPARVEQIQLDEISHEYAPVGGMPELRDAVAQLYNQRFRRGMPSQYSAENVAISAGGRLGLTRVAASLGQVHLGHFLPDYTAYAELLGSFQGFVPIPIPLDPASGFALAGTRIRDQIVGKGLGALLLSNPSNPTGCTLPTGAMSQWAEASRALDCALIADEFYAHYVYDAETPGRNSFAATVEKVDADPVVILDGVTKNWRYPGWRVAWTLAPKPVIERITSAGSFLDGGPSHPMQRATVGLLDMADADAEAAAIRSHFKKKRDIMVDRLRSMGLRIGTVPQGAFYIFADLSDLPEPLQDGMAFFEAALEEQVIVVPGAFFDVDPGHRRSHIPSRLKNYIRLSYGPDLDSLTLGLDRMQALLASA